MRASVLEDRETPPPLSPTRADGGGGNGERADPRRIGLLAFLGTVTMLFVGFTSTYMVRESAADWSPLAPPPVLYANTLILIASSFALERSRRLLRGWDLPGAQSWFTLTGALGVFFVIGQILTWRALGAQGVFLATNIHSSFFYLLTGLHGLHLLGGLAWFGVLYSRAKSLAITPGTDALALFATYWHFLAGLWLYLLFLLFVL